MRVRAFYPRARARGDSRRKRTSDREQPGPVAVAPCLLLWQFAGFSGVLPCIRASLLNAVCRYGLSSFAS